MEEVVAKLLAEIALFAGNADEDGVRDSIILDRVKTLESIARLYPTRYRDFHWKIETAYGGGVDQMKD